MKKNILSRTETRGNTAQVDDFIINEKIYIQNVPRKHQSRGGLIQNFCVNKFEVLPLCYTCQLMQLPIFLHEYTYNLYGLFSIKNKQATSQTAIYICSQGRYSPFSISRGASGGIIMISKQNITVFWGKKWDAIVPPLLYMNQEYITALKSERLPLFGIH